MNFVFYLHDETSPEVFEHKLLWFKKHYDLVSSKDVADYVYKEKNLSNACHLTVDDGWLSTYQVIFPLIKKYNVPISIFVSPHVARTGENFWYKEYIRYDGRKLRLILVEKGFFSSTMDNLPLDLIFKEMEIDKVREVLSLYRQIYKVPVQERGFVNVDELREMQASGLVEIGAHTLFHPILSNETDECSLREISRSVVDLSELLDHQVTSFAYPNGIYGLDFSEREIDFVRRCGLRIAFSVNPGLLSENTSPFNIPRTCSRKRLLLGRLGMLLPSLHDQEKPRKEIRLFRKK